MCFRVLVFLQSFLVGLAIGSERGGFFLQVNRFVHIAKHEMNAGEGIDLERFVVAAHLHGLLSVGQRLVGITQLLVFRRLAVPIPAYFQRLIFPCSQ